ncbi:MAG: EF-hand domain-containing protein [Planctomycetaceae bacterium]
MPRISLWCLCCVCCVCVVGRSGVAQEPTVDAEPVRLRVTAIAVRGEVTIPDDVTDPKALIEELRSQGKIEWQDTSRCSIVDGTSARIAVGAQRSVQRGGVANAPARSPRSGSSAGDGQPPGGGNSVREVPAPVIDQVFQRYDTDGNGELSESELPKPRDNGQRGSIDLTGPLSKLPTPISKEKFAEVLRQSIPRASAAMAPQFGGFGNRPAMASFDWVSIGSSLELSPKSESDGSISMKVEFQSDQLEGDAISAETPGQKEDPAARPSATTSSSSDMTTAAANTVVKLIPGKVRVIQSSVSGSGSSAQTLLVFVSLVAK